MANVKITDLDLDTAPASTDVLPFVDISSDETKKVTVEDLLESAGDGAVATPAFSFASDKDTGIYRPGADQLALVTGGTSRLFIDASGNTGIGTSSPQQFLHVHGTNGRIQITSTGTGSASGDGALFGYDGTNDLFINNRESTNFKVFTAGTQALTIDSSQRVGIGTSSPTVLLDLESTSPIIRLTDSDASGTPECQISGAGGDLILEADRDNEKSDSLIRFLVDGSDAMRINNNGNCGIGVSSPSTKLQLPNQSTIRFGDSGTAPKADISYSSTGFEFLDIKCQGTTNGYGNIRFFTNSTPSEAATIDSSGRLLVGTSSATHGSQATAEFQGSNSAYIFSLTNDTASDSDGHRFSYLAFTGKQSGGEKSILASVNGAHDGAADDTKGMLIFRTNSGSEGGTIPTERMRITNNGQILFHKTSGGMNLPGVVIEDYHTTRITTDSTGVDEVNLYLNRQSSDGALLKFFQANTEEGNISVNGTTVSYNGAHLSRWSQLPSGAERTDILRGTVLSNIDEMCEWGEEENEQLNRMQVSDVEGDKNVSGVFQGWDDDDDIYTNDFYCAMTGDFVIRIAQGTTVERGDLLMSAGDGTAKPQDDDIIRSKTIAKVTSTVVSETYPDGSYCVPCVLMAC